MRIISYLFWGLSLVIVILWVLAYGYISAMACAYGPGNYGRPCNSKAPWDLSGEDFQVLVLMPGIVLCVVVLIAILTWRASGKRN